jgi:EAL domain-containing protein (putative c-di-GMP-specific phosphodiesterase class I)
MVLVEGLQNAKGSDKIREVLEAYFLSISTGGDSAVRLSEDQYAVLHGEEGALDDIRHNINQLLAEANADELTASTRMWRVNIGKSELPLSDVARAIGFTLKRFASESPKGFEITDIDQTVADLLANTVDRVSRVRRTLEKRNFHLVFQPIVRLATGQLHHAEALMRIGGDDSPAEFVAFAEGIGLNTDLDLMVVQTALDILHNAYRKKQIIPDIAVNISGQSLSSRIFVDQLEKILQPFGDVSKKLLIDITDFSTLADFGLLKVALTRLRKLGLRRCLGDVGGGSSSFMSLNELAVDFAKLDGQIVHSAVREGRERTILQSIVQICSHLGIVIIAEKVETEQQRAALRNLGVPLGQGFLYGQPTVELPLVDLQMKPKEK